MLAKIQGVSNVGPGVEPGPTDILIVILIGHFILPPFAESGSSQGY